MNAKMDSQKAKTIALLKELLEKGKDCYNEIVFPKPCEINISELENYDFFVFDELKKTNRKIVRGVSDIYNIPVLTVNNEKVEFFRVIVEIHLEELENA